MRKFIMSDVQGYGNMYYSMMYYLDNINKEDDIELYINGDLIDHGFESAEILLDVIKRCKENKFKIEYLGGTHEWLMHNYFKNEENNNTDIYNNWYENGGYVTHWGLEEALFYNVDKIKDVVNYIANLRVYHRFNERVNGKPIVLVHAACPKIVKENCNLLINEDSKDVFDAVWTRKFDIDTGRHNHLGNKDFFSIIGHTPNNNKYGFEYDFSENTLNIDGGVSMYLNGSFEFNHYPLVEIIDNGLKILTFNSNNEIIYGNYYVNGIFIPMEENELNIDRSYLDNSLLVKKLSINEDGVIYYKK